MANMSEYRDSLAWALLFLGGMIILALVHAVGDWAERVWGADWRASPSVHKVLLWVRGLLLTGFLALLGYRYREGGAHLGVCCGCFVWWSLGDPGSIPRCLCCAQMQVGLRPVCRSLARHGYLFGQPCLPARSAIDHLLGSELCGGYSGNRPDGASGGYCGDLGRSSRCADLAQCACLWPIVPSCPPIVDAVAG